MKSAVKLRTRGDTEITFRKLRKYSLRETEVLRRSHNRAYRSHFILEFAQTGRGKKLISLVENLSP